MSLPLNDATRPQAEAAAFRKPVAHPPERTAVQNTAVMNLAGFCRNCMAKWLMAGAAEAGAEVSYDTARAAVYGMPYGDWKAQHQPAATPEQLARFRETQPGHAKHR